MKTIRLGWRLLLRDLRAGELHILGVALVIAVASLTSVGFFADRLSQALGREANQLLGGDLLLSADHPWDARYAGEARALGLRVVTTTSFTSMASTGEVAQLAGIKAVEPGYPLRGQLRTAPDLNRPDAVASGIPAAGTVWLDERLSSRARPGAEVPAPGGLASGHFAKGSNHVSVLAILGWFDTKSPIDCGCQGQRYSKKWISVI